MAVTKQKLIRNSIIASLFLYILIITIMLPILKTSPDSRLYTGLAENIISQTGYIDNIRNDFVLPPIGHPFLYSLFLRINQNPIYFTKFFIFLSLITIVLTINKVFSIKWTIVFALLFPLILWKQNIWIAAGIESSLFFFNSIFVFILVYLVNSEKQGKYLLYMFFGLNVFVLLIIRPILLPGVILALPIAIIFILLKRSLRLLVKAVLVLFIPFILFQALGAFSVGKYGDKRLTNGTYSGITLYSAYNNYISLYQIYRFELLYNQPEAEVNKVYADETWQERDARLKDASIQFVLNHPIKAVSGYLWRICAFTIYNKYFQYNFLIIAWFIYLIKSIRILGIKNKIFLLALALPIYHVCVSAIFVYAGARYLIALIPFFTGSIIIMQGLLQKRKIKKVKD